MISRTWRNRNGDEVIIQQKEENVFLFSVFDRITREKTKYWRYGYNNKDDKAILFVDPSGGPFVAVDSNLKFYHKDLPDKIIKQIVLGDETKLITESV